MTEYKVKRPINRPPIHPGEILKEDVLPNLRMSISQVAERLFISRQHLHRILNGTHPITPEMALRIAKFTNQRPALWLRMQLKYDLWHAERRLEKELDKIQSEEQSI